MSLTFVMSRTLYLSLVFLLAACSGGGGDSSSPTPSPAGGGGTIPGTTIADLVDTDLTVYNKPATYDALAVSIPDLLAKLATASAGDVIALANGTYSNVDISIATDGVVVVAQI